MNRLIDLDRDITILLNGLDAAVLDPIMIFASRIYVWVPLYLSIIIWYFMRWPWRRALLTVLVIVLAFAFTDKFTSFLKDSIGRFRPCEDPALYGIIRLLEKHGGLHGFPSSHAANTFCFAMLTHLTIRRKWWSTVIFFWAALISYSRIYVGKHFFGDVLCGILIGLICGYLFHMLIKKLDEYALHYRQRD